MLLFLMSEGYYNQNYGKAVVTTEGILIPCLWFRGYNDASDKTTDLERVYAMSYIDDNEDEPVAYDMHVETVYDSHYAEFEKPVQALYNGRYYFMLRPAAQDRSKFNLASQILRKRMNATSDVFESVLSKYYLDLESTGTNLLADISEGEAIVDFQYERVSVIHKMQDYTQMQLFKKDATAVVQELFPVMECDLHDSQFRPYPHHYVFDSSPEDNAYAPYTTEEGYWTFKPRDPIPSDVQQEINSGNLIFTRCTIYECKKQDKTNGSKYVDCARDFTPLFGVPVDYKLPDEKIDAPTVAGFVVICLIFGAIFVAFLYVSIMTERARARRVTDKNKNKVQAKEGGGKAGRKTDEQ